MGRKKARARKAEKLRRESVKEGLRSVGEVERWSKEHVRNAKERIWRYFEAVAFKALTFELNYGGRIPRLSGPAVHESMDWENRCCHTSAFPRNRWECICEVKAMPFSEFLKEDFADTFPEWKADPGN